METKKAETSNKRIALWASIIIFPVLALIGVWKGFAVEFGWSSIKLTPRPATVAEKIQKQGQDLNIKIELSADRTQNNGVKSRVFKDIGIEDSYAFFVDLVSDDPIVKNYLENFAKTKSVKAWGESELYGVEDGTRLAGNEESIIRSVLASCQNSKFELARFTDFYKTLNKNDQIEFEELIIQTRNDCRFLQNAYRNRENFLYMLGASLKGEPQFSVSHFYQKYYWVLRSVRTFENELAKTVSAINRTQK